MTEETATKTIKELMNGDKPGMLNLVLEHLLAPASPWRYVDPAASIWWQYDHLTLEDFKEDCEWDEKWYVQFQYDVSICNPYQDVDAASKEDAWRLASGEPPAFEGFEDEEWFYEHFSENPPERTYRDYAEVRVGVSNLRLKGSEDGQK
jgi:hypothetical protein